MGGSETGHSSQRKSYKGRRDEAAWPVQRTKSSLIWRDSVEGEPRRQVKFRDDQGQTVKGLACDAAESGSGLQTTGGQSLEAF